MFLNNGRFIKCQNYHTRGHIILSAGEIIIYHTIELIAVQGCNAFAGLTTVAIIVAELHVLGIKSILLITPA
jgi:hypothetical protein